MISCQHCEELLNARLDGELPPEDAPLLDEHLAQCPDCRKLDRDLTSLHHRLQKLSFDPPEDLTAA
ncbi:MAG: zf-HC2 domain-containing protein, partial [Ruminiclostridium sp.]|nr:zf-HC2 domain-containing protein [Ruminiclostridium sp.]